MAYFQQTVFECFMVIGSNQSLQSLSDNQVNIEIDAKLITEVKEAKSLSVIIDEQNEDRFSHSYITLALQYAFISFVLNIVLSIKDVKTVTSLNKQEVLIYQWLGACSIDPMPE